MKKMLLAVAAIAWMTAPAMADQIEMANPSATIAGHMTCSEFTDLLTLGGDHPAAAKAVGGIVANAERDYAKAIALRGDPPPAKLDVTGYSALVMMIAQNCADNPNTGLYMVIAHSVDAIDQIAQADRGLGRSD